MPSVKLSKHLRNFKQHASRYRRTKLNTSAEKKALRNNRQLFISLCRVKPTFHNVTNLRWTKKRIELKVGELLPQSFNPLLYFCFVVVSVSRLAMSQQIRNLDSIYRHITKDKVI